MLVNTVRLHFFVYSATLSSSNDRYNSFGRNCPLFFLPFFGPREKDIKAEIVFESLRTKRDTKSLISRSSS